MLRTIEASTDEHGTVTLSEPVSLKARSRALVTILDESLPNHEAAILAEAALAPGWSNPREDEAWKHLADLPDLGWWKGVRPCEKRQGIKICERAPR